MLCRWGFPVPAFLCLALALATAQGGSANQFSDELVAHLPGIRTATGAVLLDELHGRFAGIRLGMPMQKVEQILPRAYKSYSLVTGQDLSYCDTPTRRSCGGYLYISILSSCEDSTSRSFECSLTGKRGRVAEIALYAQGDPARDPGLKKIVTDRGITLGSPIATVLQRYKVGLRTHKACGDVRDLGPQSTTLLIHAGSNTLALVTFGGKVWQIRLLSGWRSALCHS